MFAAHTRIVTFLTSVVNCCVITIIIISIIRKKLCIHFFKLFINLKIYYLFNIIFKFIFYEGLWIVLKKAW